MVGGSGMAMVAVIGPVTVVSVVMVVSVVVLMVSLTIVSVVWVSVRRQATAVISRIAPRSAMILRFIFVHQVEGKPVAVYIEV